jgi:hypothetical protein
MMEEEESVTIGACLMDSEDFSADNAVFWTRSSSFHGREGGYNNTVVIGKNISATGSTVRYKMPDFLSLDATTRLCLNSRRELLFRLEPDKEPSSWRVTRTFKKPSSWRVRDATTPREGTWVNITPEGGLKEGVSSLHLLTGCFNGYDENSSFDGMQSYIKVSNSDNSAPSCLFGAC